MRAYELKPAAGRAPSFKIPYAQELNPQQLAVAAAGDGPLLVIAGAGSGKTRTLTYRVAHLIERGVDPASVLLVTFTNKAAREMLHRVEHLLALETRRIWGGTFHHVGNLVLRRHAAAFGFTETFGILDREDSKDLLEDCAERLGLKGRERRFPKGDVLLEILSLAVNTAVEPATLLERDYGALAPVAEDVLRVLHAYGHRKQELNVMDFDDLLVFWHRLLKENRAVREQWGGRFRHILVDEYQDTNRLQGEIVDSLASVHRNLMVVGDDAQSIYSFRGAHFANILSFPERYADARVYKLETNYRSTPQILTLANASIRRNTRQFEKVLRPARPDGPPPALVVGQDPEEVARFVAQRMLELHDRGVPLREMAVLYRAHYQSLDIQLELTRSNIPFLVRSGLRFFEQAHVKDVVAHLKVVVNPRDEMSWKRMIRLQPGLGKAAAERIWSRLAAATDPLAAAGGATLRRDLPPRAAKAWGALAGLLGRLAAPPVAGRPADMIDLVLRESYEAYARATFENAANRVEDIRQLANFALRYASAADLLAELALLTDLAGADAGKTDDGEDDRVVLSTVHQAKGLEWRAVFVIGLVDGAFPLGRCLGEPEGEEEERRLFYVAVTRAKDELFLAYPLVVRERGKWDVIQRPSRFVQELEPAVYEKWMLTQGDGGGAENAALPPLPGRPAPVPDELVDSDPMYEE